MALIHHLLGAVSNDSFARQNGFPDAATMAAYQAKQQARFNGAASGGPSMPSTGQSALDTAFSIHPAVLLNYVLDKFKAATGGQ